MNDQNYVRLPALAAAFFSLATVIDVAVWFRTHQPFELVLAVLFAVAAVAWFAATAKRRRQSLRR